MACAQKYHKSRSGPDSSGINSCKLVKTAPHLSYSSAHFLFSSSDQKDFGFRFRLEFGCHGGGYWAFDLPFFPFGGIVVG